MHLLDNGTQVASLGAPQAASGTPGYAATGAPGTFAETILDPDHYNSTMLEIVNAVLGAGIALDRTNNAQLLAAIEALSSWRPLGTFSFSAAASQNIPLSTSYRRFRLTVQNFVVSVAGNSLLARLSSNGGSSFLTAASYTYIISFTDTTPSQQFAATATATAMLLTPVLPANNVAGPVDMIYDIWPGTSSAAPRISGAGCVVDQPEQACLVQSAASWGGTPALFNELQLFVASGTMTGTAILEGML